MVRSARGGGAAADIERGYGGGRRGSVAASRSGGLRQYSFYLLLLGALVLMLIASRTLRSVFRREGVDAPPEGAEYETPSVTTPSVEEQQQGICARRLAEAGLDAGEPYAAWAMLWTNSQTCYTCTKIHSIMRHDDSCPYCHESQTITLPTHGTQVSTIYALND